MKNTDNSRKEPGTHKPLVGSSNLPATTSSYSNPTNELPSSFDTLLKQVTQL